MDTLTAASQTTATDSPKTTCDDHQQLLIVLKHNELNSTKNSHHAKIPSISTPAVLNMTISKPSCNNTYITHFIFLHSVFLVHKQCFNIFFLNIIYFILYIKSFCYIIQVVSYKKYSFDNLLYQTVFSILESYTEKPNT